MTLRGAVQQLKDIRDNKNFPFYLKTAISKAIETIEMERADAMDKQILVDLDALLELKVHYGETEYHFDHDAIPVDEIEDALKDGTLKVIDAETVRHGKWILVNGLGEEKDSITGGKCSLCGYVNPATSYCPHCGAKMDEVTE